MKKTIAMLLTAAVSASLLAGIFRGSFKGNRGKPGNFHKTVI